MFQSIGRQRDPEALFRKVAIATLAWGALWSVGTLAAWFVWIVLCVRFLRWLALWLWTLLFARPLPGILEAPELLDDPVEVVVVDLALDPTWEEPGDDEVLDESDLADAIARWEAEQAAARVREARLASLDSQVLFSMSESAALFGVFADLDASGVEGNGLFIGLTGGTHAGSGTGLGSGGLGASEGLGGLGTRGLGSGGGSGYGSGGGALIGTRTTFWRAEVASVAVDGPLDPATAESALKGSLRWVESCLSSGHFAGDPPVTVAITVDVDGGGGVARVAAETSPAESAASDCIERAVSRKSFGASSDGAPAVVRATVNARPSP